MGELKGVHCEYFGKKTDRVITAPRCVEQWHAVYEPLFPVCYPDGEQ